jgi:hypothetical protein
MSCPESLLLALCEEVALNRACPPCQKDSLAQSELENGRPSKGWLQHLSPIPDHSQPDFWLVSPNSHRRVRRLCRLGFAEEDKCKKQEARSKKQEARSKKQEARSKKQEAPRLEWIPTLALCGKPSLAEIIDEHNV